MQVGLLPAAPIPLPGSVKVARRSVKPFVLVRVQVWQPASFMIYDLRWRFALLQSTQIIHHKSQILNSPGKAGRYKLAAPVLKTGSARAEVGAIPTPSANFPSRSSKAEHPPDKREDAERYRAGRPNVAVRKHPRIAETD